MNSFQYKNLKEIDRHIPPPHIASNLPYQAIVRWVYIETVIVINCIKKTILWELLHIFMLIFIKRPISYWKKNKYW